MEGKNGYGKGELRRNLRAKLEEVFGSELSSERILAAVPNLRKRLYKTKEPRYPTAADMLYILLRYVGGEPAKELARQCKEAMLSGFSSTTIETVARRVAELPEPVTLQKLMDTLEPPDRHAGKLSRTLVDRLDAVAGETIGLRAELQWRHWHLVEITFFVRTGLWPPRIVFHMIPEALSKWEPMPLKVALEAARILSGKPNKSKPDKEKADKRKAKAFRKDWEQLLNLANQAGLDYRHEVLAPRVTREAVRVALTRGVRRHRWHSERFSFELPRWIEIPKRGRPRKKVSDALDDCERVDEAG